MSPELAPSNTHAPLEELAIPERPIVEPVDPLTIIPKPGPMAKLLIDVRDEPRLSDGMLLACASPKKGTNYPEIIAAYERESQGAGFSPTAFWDSHFDTPSPDDIAVHAADSEPILDYARRVREMLVIPTSKNKEFDLKLPYDRVVAGAGRFSRHEFHWDGYHMGKGHAADERWDLVLDIVGNAEYQIEKFGYPLNGSADFFASRPQPPYFSHMVRLLADRFGRETLVRFLPAMEKEYRGYWMDGEADLMSRDDGTARSHRSLVRMPDGSLLNRYWDDAEGPRYEMLKEDVELGAMVVNGLSGTARERRLAKFYKDIRGAASSGWDFSSRWMADGHNLITANTTDILPVDLNSLLLYTEETLAMAYDTKASTRQEHSAEWAFAKHKEREYRTRASDRMAAIRKYMLSDRPDGLWFNDYNFVRGAQTDVPSAATAYPMYVGMTNEAETFGTAQTIRQQLLHRYGVATTMNDNRPNQWDGKERIWAPTNWAAARGAARMGHIMLEAGDIDRRRIEELFTTAECIRKAYMDGVELAYDTFGMIPEKHHGDDASIMTGGGEYALVKVLGMPMETYVAMSHWDVRHPDRTPGILGRETLLLAA